MPSIPDFEFRYYDIPAIAVRVISTETRSEQSLEALIDTGSDLTIFDISIAGDLRLDLTNRPVRRFRGVGGRLLEGPVVELELLPLFESELTVVASVAFLPGIAASVGNLIGRDVLEYLDFALTHSTRVGYLGRTDALV